MKRENESAFAKAIRQTWREYATETSVHGLKYAIGRRRIDRWVWSVIPAVSGAFAAFLVLMLYRRYRAMPTRTVYETQFEPVASQYFPAVTVCAPRRFTKRSRTIFLEKLKYPVEITPSDVEMALSQLHGLVFPLPDEPQNLTMLDEILSMNGLVPHEVMKQMTPRCSNILLHCRWEGEDAPCSRFFERTITSDGYCCSFNYNVNLKDSSFQSTTTPFFGPQMGLSFVVNMGTEYSKQAYHLLDSFKILVHNGRSFAGRNNQRIVIPLKKEIFIAVTPLRLMSGPQVLKMSEEYRRCVLGHERKLKYFSAYRKVDCLVECEIESCIARCGCHPFGYPRDPGDVDCRAATVACLRQHFKKVQSENWGVDCDCPQQCNENSTTVEVHTVPIFDQQFNSDSLYQNLRGNQSLIHVYYGKQVATVMKRSIITLWVDLISSFGGMFNLFMGCSFLSLLEVIYFIVMRFPRHFSALRKTPTNRVININVK